MKLWLALSMLTCLVSPCSARRPRPAPPSYHSQKLVTMDFLRADLVYVIKVLAHEMGCNVYIGSGVEGRVTVSLRQVPAQAALHMILQDQKNRLAYKLSGRYTLIVAEHGCLDQIDNDIIRCPIGPRTKSDQVRQEYLLERAPASQVITVLQRQYQHVEFIPHPTMNGFYAVGTRADILLIKNDVPSLDRTPADAPEPLRECVALQFGDPAEVCPLLKTLVPGLQVSTDPPLSSELILEGNPEALGQAKELLDVLDKPLDQVVIECKLVSLPPSGEKKLGLSWQTPPWLFLSESVLHLDGKRVTNSDPASPPGHLELATFRPQVPADLNFRIAQSQALTLASPRVAVRKGNSTRIHIGDKFPALRFDPQTGEFRESYVNQGVQLTITPVLDEDGWVNCKIEAEVSSLLDLIDQQITLTCVRRFATEVRVQDGQTLALGGIWTPPELQAVQRVPLLGELPILGSIFRRGAPVVLMLTPQIMK